MDTTEIKKIEMGLIKSSENNTLIKVVISLILSFSTFAIISLILSFLISCVNSWAFLPFAPVLILVMTAVYYSLLSKEGNFLSKAFNENEIKPSLIILIIVVLLLIICTVFIFSAENFSSQSMFYSLLRYIHLVK